MLTGSTLERYFSYDPSTGVFTRKITRSSNAIAGSAAGTRDKDGYVQIEIDGSIYKAHRLAWVWMTGKWPSNDIDHKDGDTGNNRWGNLREATQTQNNANASLRIDNSSGFKGVCFDKSVSRWKAQIQSYGKNVGLGHFDTPEDAHAAYLAAAKEVFGEFARAA